MESKLNLKEQKRAESDERILRAAAKIFGTMGYSRTTLAMIAEEAGVSQGLVSQRFISKENLLNEVFDQTLVLTFDEEESRHMPNTYYILLDHFKLQAREQPDWYSFISMLHTGKDTPDSFNRHAREVFDVTPLRSSLEEAQARNELPAGDPWDIFRVFFRNSTNLIGWYHQFGLPMPENYFFLYAIQYTGRRKEAEEKLRLKDYKIQRLKTDREMMFSAVSDIFPLILFCNITKNTYYAMQDERYPTAREEKKGVYDDLVLAGVNSIPNEIHKTQFLRLFSRENVISARESGRQQLCLRHQQTGSDGIVRWVETRMLFKTDAEGDLLAVAFAKVVDGEMERLSNYGAALRKADEAITAKNRFLAEFSRNVRTPMSTVTGCTEMLKRHADDPEKVKYYTDMMTKAEEELMRLLMTAMSEGQRREESSGTETVVNLYDSTGNLITTAARLAGQRSIALDYQMDVLRNDSVLADELRMHRIGMSLLMMAFNRSAPGDRVCIRIDQPEVPKDGKICLRVTMNDNEPLLSEEIVQQLLGDIRQAEEIAPELTRIRRDILSMGGKMEIGVRDGKNIVACTFYLRRV